AAETEAAAEAEAAQAAAEAEAAQAAAEAEAAQAAQAEAAEAEAAETEAAAQAAETEAAETEAAAQAAETEAAAEAATAEAQAPDAVAAAPTGPQPLELTEASGKREGRVHAVEPGASIVIGTARKCDVVLRQRGVGYRHAVLHYRLDGSCELEDLGGSGGTYVDQQQVPSKGRLPVPIASAELRVGEALLRLRGEAPAPAKPEPVLAPPEPDAGPPKPWQPPTPAQVAAARHTDPQAILRALPPSLLDLVASAARATPLAEHLAAQPRGERAVIQRDAEDFVFLARSVLDTRWLPEPEADWIRWDESQQQFLARSQLEDGTTVILRPWELLARFATPVIEIGAYRVTAALARILASESERLYPDESEELSDGFWRCRYSSPAGLLNARFSEIEARSNGHVVAVELQPRFAIDPLRHGVGEDPLAFLLGDADQRNVWRPGPASVGPPAPRFPSGGRHARDRHLPQRSKVEERPWRR
ncbi:MAG TPA: hypothetical protein DEA08_28845, partial [Planctomycetes bacterium]|nr:hypothetical protein [Planctomycetota bacterium]